jgi:cell division protein FtsQ
VTVETASTQTTIDPRVAARRTQLARERSSRRLRIALIVLGVVVFVVASVGVFFTPIFDVDHIIVRGASALPASTVSAASGITRGDPLILVRPGSAAHQIERLPYIANARVKRIFPGTVVITVRERTPVAYAQQDDAHFALLDASGRVLVIADVPPALPRIDGLLTVPAAGQRVKPAEIANVVPQLTPGLRSLLGAVQWENNELTLHLVDGLDVRMGDLGNIPAKAAVAEAVIARNTPGTKVVDVRVPTSPVSK